MEQYKVAAVTPGVNGFLELWTRDGERVSAFVPNIHMDHLKPGKILRIFRNAQGIPLVYGFGWKLFFPVLPKTDEEREVLLGQIPDICHFHLDRLVFKYSLRRTLRDLGMRAVRQSKINLQMYVLSYNRYEDKSY